MKIVVTGTAGFIGSTLAIKLLELGFDVLGIDNHNDYYEVKLKEDRVERLSKYKNYIHKILDLANFDYLDNEFSKFNPDVIVNLAAQAGVRYSMENPKAYIDSNIVGFANILELSRKFKIKHLVYASSSSVYGANSKMPFSIHDNVDKRCNKKH
jgi:UDP-glucuronate 4-epimerase